MIYESLVSFIVPAGHSSTDSASNQRSPPPLRPQEGFIGGKEAPCTLSRGLLNPTGEFALPPLTIVQTAAPPSFITDRFSAPKKFTVFAPSERVFNSGLCEFGEITSVFPPQEVVSHPCALTHIPPLKSDPRNSKIRSLEHEESHQVAPSVFPPRLLTQEREPCFVFSEAAFGAQTTVTTAFCWCVYHSPFI